MTYQPAAQYATFDARLAALFNENKAIPKDEESLFNHNVARSALVRDLVASDTDGSLYEKFARAEAAFYQREVTGSKGAIELLRKKITELKEGWFKSVDHALDAVISLDEVTSKHSHDLITHFLRCAEKQPRYYTVVLLTYLVKQKHMTVGTVLKTWDQHFTTEMKLVIGEFEQDGVQVITKNANYVYRWLPSLKG
jgi:hypothetical protein